jgi:hypothetical protein
MEIAYVSRKIASASQVYKQDTDDEEHFQGNAWLFLLAQVLWPVAVPATFTQGQAAMLQAEALQQ